MRTRRGVVSSSPEERGIVTLEVPPSRIKRLEDPYDDNRHFYECLTSVQEAAKLIIGEANPRKQDRKKPIPQQILATLQNEPTIFHVLNRGIWVAAERAEYDNQKQVLTVYCPQRGDERYGVVDGGHTRAMIDEDYEVAAEDSSAVIKTMPYVRLHLCVGVEDVLEKMAESLNRSAQLKEYALDNYKGEFDELKTYIKGESFASDIGFTENEGKEYDVLDLIQRMTLFCVGIYPNIGAEQPTIAYSSKNKCLAQFIKNKAEYLALRPIMADCFRLPDQIEVLLAEVSKSERFGKFNFSPKRKTPVIRPSLKGIPGHWRSSYAVSEAVIYPLAASLRVLIRSRKSDGVVLGWRTDPVKFFTEHGYDLFECVRRYYDDSGKSLSTMGKRADFWQNLHHIAYVAAHPEE